jgi:hypothetical protein
VVGSRTARDCGGFKTRLPRKGLHEHVSKTFGVLRADSSRNPLVLHVFLKNKRINYTRAGFVIRNGQARTSFRRGGYMGTWHVGPFKLSRPRRETRGHVAVT